RTRSGIEWMRAIGITRTTRPPGVVNRPGNFQCLLDLGVVVPHLPPIERPIRSIAEQSARFEPFRTEAKRHHREMHGRAADRLSAIVAAHLHRVGAIDDAIVGPVEFGLLAFVGSKILKRTKIRACIECHYREAVFGELACERATSGAGSDDCEIHWLIFSILAHRHPSAWTEDVGRSSFTGSRSLQGIIEHGGSPDAPTHHRRPWLRLLPTDRARRSRAEH